MFYRRKVILALIEQFGGLSRTKLQKLLFLFTRNQSNKSFDFIPYKYGCYSFQANNDLRILSNQKLIKIEIDEEENSTIVKSFDLSYFLELKKIDREILFKIKKGFENYSQEELIRYTYLNYPFYAINSKISSRILSKDELKTVKKQEKKYKDKLLFTIGYEGISLETYINKLIINGVSILCDVRKNSFSMKYGFSKNQLINACNSVGIDFIHIPELGIVSEKRKELKSLNDYKVLFNEYEKTVLIENQNSLEKIKELFKNNKRIALTCFEKEVCMCHRGKVAEALLNLPNWNIPLRHLS